MSSSTTPTTPTSPNFPAKDTRQMPCNHWRHFPVTPEPISGSPPPDYFVYCRTCSRDAPTPTPQKPTEPFFPTGDPRGHKF